MQELDLPDELITKLINEAQKNRVYGKGRFCYVPIPFEAEGFGVLTKFIVCFFAKPVFQNNIKARPWDISLTLDSEWNHKENPID